MNTYSRPPKRRFLDLPFEIRLLVYESLFPNSYLGLVWLHSPTSRRKVFVPSMNLDILSTCHFLRSEATAYLFKRKPILLSVGQNPIYGINAFIQRFHLSNTALLRRLIIHLGEQDISMWGNRGTLSLERVASWVKKLPALTELRLVYNRINMQRLRGRSIPSSAVKHMGFLKRVLLLVETEQTLRWGTTGGLRLEDWGYEVHRLVFEGRRIEVVPWSG